MVIVIDDFAVDSNTVQPKAKPVVPPVTPLYDDNTMYNATVYPGQQVSAPSAAEQPVVYQAPTPAAVYDYQQYTDPYTAIPDSQGYASPVPDAITAEPYWVNEASLQVSGGGYLLDPKTGQVWIEKLNRWGSLDELYSIQAQYSGPGTGSYNEYVAPGGVATPLWESATQTYRDPASGLLWLDDGTPGGQWISDATWAARKVLAYAPPPVETEDTYDFSDATDDALWRMLAPGTALSEELVSAGVLIPPLPNLDLGGPYLLNEIGRARYNTDQLNMYPYSDPARAYFESNPPITLNSGFMRRQDSPDKGDGANASDAGLRIGDRVRSDIFPHERAHQWQWTQMGHEDEQPTTHQEFLNNAYAALSDPSVPSWVKFAIRGGVEHGSGKGLSISYEVFATLAAAAAGRLAELPPYLRHYFDTLYTR